MWLRNLEYRITIAGPVSLAPFVDTGIEPILRDSQLKINDGQFDLINTTIFGCPALDVGLNCVGGATHKFPQYLSPVPGTNWTPRMSTGRSCSLLAGDERALPCLLGL